MSESEPTSPTPAPSSAAATGSSSSDSTPKGRRNLRITALWQITAARMTLVAVAVVLLWVAALTIPSNSDFLYGAASGGTIMMLAIVALFVAKRFGYETFFVRELEKRDDERDKAALQRACALTGVVGLIGNVIAVTVSAFGGPVILVLSIVLWIQLISFIGGNIYFNRTM